MPAAALVPAPIACIQIVAVWCSLKARGWISGGFDRSASGVQVRQRVAVPSQSHGLSGLQFWGALSRLPAELSQAYATGRQSGYAFSRLPLPQQAPPISLIGLISAARFACPASHVGSPGGLSPTVVDTRGLRTIRCRRRSPRTLCRPGAPSACCRIGTRTVCPHATHPHRPRPAPVGCAPLLPPTDADGVCRRAAQHRARQPRQPAPAGLPAGGWPGPAWSAGRLRAHLVSACPRALGPDGHTLTPPLA